MRVRNVATAMTLLPQAQVRLKIVPPGAKSGFVVVGVVYWEKRGEDWQGPFPAGYGVRFTELDSDAVEAIRGILESAVVPPIDPPSHDTKSESSGLLDGDTTATVPFDVHPIPKERGPRKGKEEGPRPCPTCGK